MAKKGASKKGPKPAKTASKRTRVWVVNNAVHVAEQCVEALHNAAYDIGEAIALKSIPMAPKDYNILRSSISIDSRLPSVNDLSARYTKGTSMSEVISEVATYQGSVLHKLRPRLTTNKLGAVKFSANIGAMRIYVVYNAPHAAKVHENFDFKPSAIHGPGELQGIPKPWGAVGGHHFLSRATIPAYEIQEHLRNALIEVGF